MEIFLARWLGIYFLIMGIFILMRRPQLHKLVEEIKQNNLLIALTGSWRIFVGLFILMSKPDWHWDWTLLINLIAVIIILSGLHRLFMPHSFVKLLGKMKARSFLVCGIICLILGLFLGFFGFFLIE